jgi:transcriptional regulator with XRE-family HTH domain
VAVFVQLKTAMSKHFDYDRVLKKAYEAWLWQYASDLREADEILRPFLEIQTRRPNEHSWLRLARQASRRSTRDIAAQLGIDHSTWISLENREQRGAITIERLQNAAQALDCELIYAIRPKNIRTFAENIWHLLEQRIRPHIEKLAEPQLPLHHDSTIQSYEARIIRLATALARDLSSNPSFRKSVGWRAIRKHQRRSRSHTTKPAIE